MGRVRKEGFETIWLAKRGCVSLNGESELEQKLLTPTSQDNDIKTDGVVCCICFLFQTRSIHGRAGKSRRLS